MDSSLQPLIKIMPPTDLPTGSLMEAFSQLRFLFPGNSNLNQVNKTLARIRAQPKQNIYKTHPLTFGSGTILEEGLERL